MSDAPNYTPAEQRLAIETCGRCGAPCAYHLTWVEFRPSGKPSEWWCDDCLATIKHKGDGADSKRKPKDPTDGLIQ